MKALKKFQAVPSLLGCGLQGYLAHKKQRPPRTLQKDYAWGPMVTLGGGAVSYGRGTPVQDSQDQILVLTLWCKP